MRQDVTLVATAVTCCVVVLASEPALIGLLRRAAVMDSPNERSSHSVPTPRGGGAPIAAALVVVSLLAYGRTALPFALAVGAFGAVGLVDDLRGLKAAVRLIGQAVISVLVTSLLIWQTAGHGPLGRLEGVGLPWPATAVIIGAAGLAAVLWLTGFVNAFNFMDGINGISAGHAIVGGLAYGFLGVLEHDSFIAAAGAAVAATGLAFLPWNAFHARVFLGDVGSYALGAGLAVLAIDAVLRGVPVEAAAAPLALYLADTFWTLQRRFRAGERWLEPHRTHAYQRLCDVGWSHQQVALTTSMVSAVICVLGYASLTSNPDLRIAGDVVGVAVLVLYLASPALVGREYQRAETA